MLRIAWYESDMILARKSMEYFKMLEAKVSRGMVRHSCQTPYWIDDDPVIRNYEMLRKAWIKGFPVEDICKEFGISRSRYYEKEKQFVEHGVPALFSDIRPAVEKPDLERLVITVSKARASLSQQAILRIAEAIPATEKVADINWISRILASHGRSASDRPTDRVFWQRIQRTLSQLKRMKGVKIHGRNRKQKRKTFFNPDDTCHVRMELLRELFHGRSETIKEVCRKFGMSQTGYYRLVGDYRLFGPWAVIPANMPGKESMKAETELNIILSKLRQPYLSAMKIVETMELKCSRFAVNRVFSRWGLTDRNREPVALDHHCMVDVPDSLTPEASAWHLCSEKSLLESRRINRHFESIRKKMRTREYHLCDPGPLLLAPFVNELGIVQALEIHGPLGSRGKDLSSLALLNVFRILGGYRRINHLSDNRDRSVALASGLGMFGSRSKYYRDTMEFKFDQLHALRCDLITRARELKIVEGTRIALDFHFKEFFGSQAREKGLGKGPDKSGNIVPGFRPHVAWDIAANTILSMTYYHGGVRAPGIVEQYCERHIFPLFDPLAIREIYMDSEYTKEATLGYFKQVRCPNGDVCLCLKKNRQIKKLIAPALSSDEGWEKREDGDEIATVDAELPKTGLPLKIVILRDSETRENVRCFASTNMRLSSRELLEKYRCRWLIENGLKDLVYSYFLDEMYGNDPEKIEFEFYCVMIARLTYEYFLKSLADDHYRNGDGDKTTLVTMRNLLFEKRNFMLGLDSEGNFVATFLDSAGNDLERRVAGMLAERLRRGLNKVLWWGNRGIALRFRNQY